MYDRLEDRPPFDTWDRAVLRDYCTYGLLPDGDGFVLACRPEVEASIYENSLAVESYIYPEMATTFIPVHVARSGMLSDPSNVMGSSPTAPDLATGFARGTDPCARALALHFDGIARVGG
jgi:hypothetical protein